jgi:hypothetical protein
MRWIVVDERYATMLVSLDAFGSLLKDIIRPGQQIETRHMGLGLQLRAFCTQNKETSTVARQLYRELLRLTQQLPKYAYLHVVVATLQQQQPS